MRNNPSKSSVLIVDAYSTGRFVAPYLCQINSNYYRLHVQSSHSVPWELNESNPKDFDKDFGIFDGKTKFLKRLKVKGIHVGHVIPGAETGVELADYLAYKLECRSSNDYGLAQARRDKLEMQIQASSKVLVAKTYKVKNLKTLKHLLTSYFIEEAQRSRNSQLNFPVVLKPVQSAGGDGVVFCNTLPEAEQEYRKLRKSRDKLGNLNNKILVQEYLQGSEYCVNAVSIDGNHFFTDLWEYKKRKTGKTCIYDCDELLAFNKPVSKRLINYAANVLDSVGIKFGASHTEIIDTPKGPRLVETASRLQGAVNPDALKEALGYDPILLTIQSYIEPHKLQELMRCEDRFQMLKSFLFCVHLIAPKPVNLNVMKIEGILKCLKTYFPPFYPNFADGKDLDKTTDLFTSPGYFYLASESKEQLQFDYNIFRNHEQGRLYS